MKQYRLGALPLLRLAFAVATLVTLSAVPTRAQEVTTLIQFTNVWKYLDTGVNLGTAWRTNTYDDSSWPSGRGFLGLEIGNEEVYTLHAPFGTILPLSVPAITYYFRTTFDFHGLTEGLSLVATNLVDDGCVLYLNGLPIGSVRAPPTYNASTPFYTAYPEGLVDTVTVTDLHALRQGENLLAVEVHQADATSSDLVWGMKLMAVWQTPLTITNQPQDQTTMVGDPLALNVGVYGGPASYRWYKNGAPIVPIVNSINPTFTVASTTYGDAGAYSVVITNGITRVTSDVATVTVKSDLIGPRLLSAIVDGLAPHSLLWRMSV